MKKEKKDRITIYLEKDTFRRLRQYAFSEEISRTVAIEVAIQEFLKREKK